MDTPQLRAKLVRVAELDHKTVPSDKDYNIINQVATFATLKDLEPSLCVLATALLGELFARLGKWIEAFRRFDQATKMNNGRDPTLDKLLKTCMHRVLLAELDDANNKKGVFVERYCPIQRSHPTEVEQFVNRAVCGTTPLRIVESLSVYLANNYPNFPVSWDMPFIPISDN